MLGNTTCVFTCWANEVEEVMTAVCLCDVRKVEASEMKDKKRKDWSFMKI